MKRATVFFLLSCFIGMVLSENVDKSNDVDDTGRQSKSDDILSDFMDNCVNSEVQSVSTCLKLKVLHYFDYDVGRIGNPRSLSNNDVDKIDRLVVKRFQKYLKTHEFRVQLPEFFFQGANLVFSPKKGLADFDVVFPKAPETEDRSMSAARDMMQQKALLPLLMMLKMKMKMITPIMLTMVSMKATKALVMSKLALLLVVFFMASQFIKKLGMNLPMLHPPMEVHPMSMSTPLPYGPPPPPSSAYGAPSPPASSYGSPSQSSYGSPSQSSYGSAGQPTFVSSASSSNYAEPSSWEPSSSSSNTYSKVWDPQQIAYSAYYKPSSGSSSSSSSTSSS